MTTTPEPTPGEDPGVPPDEQQPEVTPLTPEPGPEIDPGKLPDTEPQLP